MNLAARFKALVPLQPLLRGQVVSSAAGTTVVALQGGAEVSVRGSAAAGAWVFVRGGAIEGPAPALASPAVIEV